MIIKKSNIKVNYLLNVSRLALNILMLVVSMPYISRVLGSKSIGHVEYAYAIIEYFFLFSALGIPMYGIRQIAKCRDDVTERSRVVLELLIILTVTTLIAYAGLYILLQTANYTADFKSILSFLGIGIVLSNFGVEWFYQGIEDQKFITIRHIFVKVVALLYLFFFVKTPSDTYAYGLFLIISTFGGSLFNMLYLRNFIRFDKHTMMGLNIRRHLGPSLTIFLGSVSISIYLQLDKIMLGNMVSDSAVGFYTQAVKLPRQALAVVTIMGSVMLPRLSNLLHHGNKGDYNMYMEKSLKYILLVAVPVTLLFVLLAHDIILVMAGTGFMPAVITLQICAPLIFVVSLASYMGFQILYPLGREMVYTIAVTVAAVINFVFNIFTIKYLKQDGAAIGTLLAEVVGVVIMAFACRKTLIETGFFKASQTLYFIAGAVMAGIMYACSFLSFSPIVHIFAASAAGMCAYVLILFLMGETTIKEALTLARGYIK